MLYYIMLEYIVHYCAICCSVTLYDIVYLLIRFYHTVLHIFHHTMRVLHLCTTAIRMYVYMYLYIYVFCMYAHTHVEMWLCMHA